MQDPLSLITGLRRPALLVRAARHLAHRRPKPPLRTGLTKEALRLMELESTVNEARLTSPASYSAQRHVGLLAQLIAVSENLRDRMDQTKASGSSAFLRET